jgi:hypothetical protein
VRRHPSNRKAATPASPALDGHRERLIDLGRREHMNQRRVRCSQ